MAGARVLGLLPGVAVEAGLDMVHAQLNVLALVRERTGDVLINLAVGGGVGRDATVFRLLEALRPSRMPAASNSMMASTRFFSAASQACHGMLPGPGPIEAGRPGCGLLLHGIVPAIFRAQSLTNS